MRIKLNSKVHIRLFERVDVAQGNRCHRIWDLIGADYADGRCDAISAGYASQFHDDEPVEVIRQKVEQRHQQNKAEAATPVDKPLDPAVAQAVESGFCTPYVQPLYDLSIDMEPSLMGVI